MSTPAFIILKEEEQVLELRSYLKSKGGAISEQNAETGLIADLQQVIHATDVIWKEVTSDQEVETVFNSIISLVMIVPPDKNDGLVAALSEQLTASDKHSASRIRLLSNLFHGLEERSVYRYNIYLSMVKLAGSADLLQMMNTKLDDVKKWLNDWEVSPTKQQVLLRALHDAFTASKQTDKATKVMIELLGTYTSETASQAREDAHRCIVTCLADPSTFLLDHLLVLKPVQFLEGELIHTLLTIFVSGKLSQYVQFYASNKEFTDSTGLSHEQNMMKMRMLTFMQMCESRTEIDFAMLQQELQLNADEIEAFIIEVVRTQTVRCKIDEMAEKVTVSSTTHRTFGRPQWQSLRDTMSVWQEQLTQVMGSLQQVMR
ncbi:hypothetical protein CAPTEDRAFT_21963 [Capitella teleta]|uniref:Eukaryotic translation initiation factor 3 subunit M n=1 Tax=Capitella teleta TaxID=283909 RepID=R7TGI6_CAPTE|nr:hypothetical protein CAPTEDRAFT_21963 [Capitella teleta]|eukprot:ELT92903.1 hypothetical protein CAPTEDRAFT_21963 [Capitella teleta]